MKKLSPDDLLSQQEYNAMRDDFRTAVMEHKARRRVMLGANASFHFEDRMTIKYQVQEMLRIEKITDLEGIEEELLAYNDLIPDGGNLKATFMLEYEHADERKVALENLLGIEDTLWVQVNDMPRVYAIADEDLERSTAGKTSAVHFLRFEFDEPGRRAIKAGGSITVGCSHQAYPYQQTLEHAQCESLANDITEATLH